MKKSFRKAIILLSVILMDVLAGMEFDLFVPSFPELQNHFQLTPFLVEALLSVNFAAYCLSLLFVGGLADRYGRKPILLIGLVTFIVGSMLCLWANSYGFLLVGRFLQGLGIASPAILSFLIIADAYTLKKQQYLMGILNGLMNLSVGAAPVVGSYITLYFHWRGNFIALLSLGVAILIMVIACVPTAQLPEKKETLSLRGYIPLFKSKPLMLLIMNFAFEGVPYWIFVGMSPLLYIKSLGVSLSHFGFYQGALAFIFGLGSIIFGFIISRSDSKKMLTISIQFGIISLICLAWITFVDSPNPLLITLAILPFVIAQIAPSIILYPLCLSLMPQAKGRVSSITQSTRLILTALSLQVAAFYYQGSFQNIGVIIIGFVVISLATLFWIISNRELMKPVPE